VAGQLDGFVGVGPTNSAGDGPLKGGWGCDSGKDSPWKNPANPKAPVLMVPSCIPRQDRFGPYRPSPVKHIPTILDRVSYAGLTWKIYADTAPSATGYIWSICPTLASCIYDPKRHNHPSANWQERETFFDDAAAGQLPAYSAVMPNFELSQHNHRSMRM